MISLSRTEDAELIRSAVTHPAVWDQVSDDTSGPSESFSIVFHPRFCYVAAHDGTEFLGVFLFEQRGVCLEVHTCLLPSCGGFRAVRAAREVVSWIWRNSLAKRIVTNVPRYNQAAFKLAKLAGLEEFGVNSKSWLKNRKLHDQIMLGISSPEVIEQCQS